MFFCVFTSHGEILSGLLSPELALELIQEVVLVLIILLTPIDSIDLMPLYVNMKTQMAFWLRDPHPSGGGSFFIITV